MPRILVIDDDPSISELVSINLEIAVDRCKVLENVECVGRNLDLVHGRAHSVEASLA